MSPKKVVAGANKACHCHECGARVDDKAGARLSIPVSGVAQPWHGAYHKTIQIEPHFPAASPLHALQSTSTVPLLEKSHSHCIVVNDRFFIAKGVV